MYMSILLCLSLIFNLFLVELNSIAVEESSTGAILSFPDVIDGDLVNVTWEVEPAAFGFADYGGTLEAFLVLPKNTSYHLECDDGEPAITLEDEYFNQYVSEIKELEGEDALFILVIDRGDCYFATKVYNAENIGASGVIMLDYKQEGFIIMWEPDDFKYDVTIPSVMLKNNYAKLLMKHLNVNNWNPKQINETTYPIAGGMGTNTSFIITKAIIEWGLPHEDDRVEWEIWTAPNDDRTIEFKRNFKETALMLDYNNYTVFTPHYYLLNGSHWHCHTKYPQCGKQCTNRGRYCAYDPEGNIHAGVDGMDVVQESLRQLCIWNFTKHDDTSIHNESIWWDYSVLWNDYCFNSTTDETKFNSECSYRQIDHLDNIMYDGRLGLSAYVNNCIETSGGYGYSDNSTNTFIDYEIRFRETESIYILPSFRVNEFNIYGEVDCDVLTEDGCAVLDSICSGFLDGTQPDICYATPAPTPMMCSNESRDCYGTCYGTKQYDRCGNCLELDSNEWNGCVGCDNVTSSGFEYNHCGLCINSNWTNFTTVGEDCQNIGHCDDGTYSIDRCGSCLAINSNEWDSCVGCDNVTNSGFEYNPCGYCMNSKWDNFTTYGQDCRGTNNENYCEPDIYFYDECNQCLKSGSSEWDNCVGCDGVAYSNASYKCGLCVVPGTPQWESACNTDSGGGETIILTEQPIIVDNTDSNAGTMSTIALIIGAVAVIIICIAGVIIYKLQKKQREQSKAFDNILKTYSLMDENPSGGGNGNNSNDVENGGKRSKRRKKKEKIPQNEDEYEEDDQVL